MHLREDRQARKTKQEHRPDVRPLRIRNQRPVNQNTEFLNESPISIGVNARKEKTSLPEPRIPDNTVTGSFEADISRHCSDKYSSSGYSSSSINSIGGRGS